jgi:hypothetical protein
LFSLIVPARIPKESLLEMLEPDRADHHPDRNPERGQQRDQMHASPTR